MGSFVPGTLGTSERRASWRPAVFEPSASMASADGPYKGDAGFAAGAWERGIFREEAVTGMQGVAARAARDVHQLIDAQIAFADGAGPIG